MSRACSRKRLERLRHIPTTASCDLGTEIQSPQIREYRHQLSNCQLLNKSFRVAVWPRLLVATILMRRYGFNLRPVHVRFAVC